MAGSRIGSRNRALALACGVVAASMVGASFAAVPLYRLFCQVTGYGGTTQRADAAPETVLDRQITVRFDSNVAPGLSWEFQPAQRKMALKIGEEAIAFYRATNDSDRTVTGSAVFNVTPDQAGAYFNKIQCFCFTEQTLEPGQTVDMPVVFFVDPDIVNDPDTAKLTTITLSYTFFPAAGPAEARSAADTRQLN